MAPRVLRVETEQALLPYLFEQFPELKRGDVKRMLRFGSVRVNKLSVTRHDKLLKPGDEVTVDREYRRKEPIAPGLEIVHEDTDLIVINKPAGLLTVSTAHEHARTAHQLVTEYVQDTDRRHGRRVYVVHRLDRETSGLLLFARNQRVHQALQDHWKDVEKRYYAVVEGIPREEEGVIRSHLAQDSSLRVRSVRPSDDTKYAETRYKIIRTREHRSLLDVQLETGRKNQIRVHLADLGCPVAGDAKYGSKVGPGGRMALHAYKLAFTHPGTGERMEFVTPLPRALERILAGG